MNQEHAQHVANLIRWCMQSGTPMPYNVLQPAAQAWDALVAEGDKLTKELESAKAEAASYKEEVGIMKASDV